MNSLKPFYFTRHGQTDWNLQNRAMGITDIPLNEFGEMQSKVLSEQIKSLPIKTICHSPLLRAKKTAEILNEALQCPMIEIEELKEFNLGDRAGSTIGSWFDDWLQGALLPGGETFSECMERTMIGIEKSLSFEGPVLIVAHGGTYWTLQRALNLLQLPDLHNCSLINFIPPRADDQNWKLRPIQVL